MLSKAGIWIPVDSSKNDILYKQLVCPDSLHCMIQAAKDIAGNTASQYLYNTNNGFANKSMIYSDSSHKDHLRTFKINNITYPAPELCFVTNDSGLVLKTTDKGENWKKIQNDKNTIQYIAMTTKNYGWLDSYKYDQYLRTNFYVTDDGGNSWQLISYNDIYKDYNIPLIRMFDNNKLICLVQTEEDSNKLIKSNDLGKTWEEITPTNINNINFYFYNFLNSSFGWLLSKSPHPEEKNKVIYLTTDGGHTWNLISDPIIYNKEITEIKFFDELHGLAIGNNYFITRTTDGGSHWYKESIFPYNIEQQGTIDLDLKSINFISIDCAYILGIYHWVDDQNHYRSQSIIYKYDASGIGKVIDNFDDREFTLYPNPSFVGSDVFIKYPSLIGENIKIKIVDILGNNIFSMNYVADRQNICLHLPANIPMGLYYIEIDNQNYIKTEKFIILR
jgi:photosystem II stability/assembly factor-like uncharacterized protein